MSIVHVGFRKARGGKLLEVHTSQNVDRLPCDIWEYCGRRETTAQEMRARLSTSKAEVLAELNARPGCNFQNIRVIDCDNATSYSRNMSREMSAPPGCNL